MNPIQSNFPALQKIWSKQGGAYRVPKFWGSIPALLLSDRPYFSLYFSSNISLIFCHNQALFSDGNSFDANALKKLDRLNSVHPLRAPWMLLHVPSFPDQSHPCSHTEMAQREGGKTPGQMNGVMDSQGGCGRRQEQAVGWEKMKKAAGSTE